MAKINGLGSAAGYGNRLCVGLDLFRRGPGRIAGVPMKPLLPIITALTATPALADPCEAPLPKRGEVFSGRVAYVGDGDSLCVASQGGLIEVRLADWYAPELAEPGGKVAKSALSRIAMGRTAVCVAGKRSYDRVVASCAIAGVNIGDRMRQAGIVEGGRGK